MGVQGLWDVLSKAGQLRSLAHIAVVDGFEKNISTRRAYRIGVDASIWYQHAMHSTKEGANPELRLLLFRLRKLAELPFIPLFIFDGCERPRVKRGSKKGKSGSHGLTTAFKKLLDVFGMEWRMALGEAEAELAHLNKSGFIDAVLTDDVDALIFGARTVIRNASLDLTGNRANPATDMNGKPSEHHVMTFSAEAIRTNPGIRMSRGGLILFALVSGGDYDDGLEHFGQQTAHCLARLGFGDQLLREYENCQGRDMGAFLSRWRADMNTEIHTNAHNLLRSQMPALTIPDTFPNMEVLRCYVNPVCSASAGRPGGGNLRDNGDLSVPGIASFCENHFDEWGYRSIIIKRFRNLIWGAAVMRVLRRAALEADEREKTRRIAAGRNNTCIHGPLRPSVEEEVGTSAQLIKKYLSPSEVDRRAAAFVRRDNAAQQIETMSDTGPLIRRIVGTRRHVSTDNILEYRVEVDPTQLVRLAESGITGKHREPPGANATNDHVDLLDLPDFTAGSSQGSSQPKKPGPPTEPYSVKRMWLPGSMMRQVHPRLVEEYEVDEEAKRARKTRGKRRRGEDADAAVSSEDEGSSPVAQDPAVSSRKRTKRTFVSVGDNSAVSRDRDMTCASARGGRLTKVEIDIRAESSLPMRQCGFIFTFPDPDSPDMLVTDEDETTGVLVELDADEEPPRMSQPTSQPVPPSYKRPPPVTSAIPRSQPGPSRRAASAGSSAEEDYISDVPDDGVRSWQDAMMDSVLLPKSRSTGQHPASTTSARAWGGGRERGRGKGRDNAPPARRPRASAPAATSGPPDLNAVSTAFDSGTGAPVPDEGELDDDANSWMDAILTGRGKGKASVRGRGRPRGSVARGRAVSAGRVPPRKTIRDTDAAMAVNRNASPARVRPAQRPSPLATRCSGTPPPRASHPMPLLSPPRLRASASDLLDRPQALDKQSEPLFLPSPSPPAPGQGRKRARSMNDDVIEIDSSEDDRATLAALKRRCPTARLSSSRPRRSSDGGFLQGADVVIDLTI